MPVTVSSDLPLRPDVVADLITRPALLRHLVWPWLTFPDALPARFAAGESVSVRLRLLGVVPLWRHTVHVAHVDLKAMEAITEEHGGPLRRWRHRLHAAPTADGGCRYTDEVDLDVGPCTPVAAVLARAVYRYRHRRWASLARVLADPA